MKGFYLLIVFLLSILSEAAGQAIVPAPNDLVVTAKIVGYGYDFVWGEKGPGPITLYAEMTVRNSTDHIRDIYIMSCSWPESWLASWPHGLFNPTFQPICDKNSRTRISIPVGEAVIFNCPLYMWSKLSTKNGSAGEVLIFRMGFVDLKPTNLLNFKDDGRDARASIKQKKSAKLKKEKIAPDVYWSHFITNEINPDTAKKITGDGRYFSYHLTQNSK